MDMALLPGTTTMGRIALTVADLSRSLEYYQEKIGLAVHEQSATEARLGVGDKELLRLVARPGVKPFPSRGFTGLYHFAILLPTREALGVELRHLAMTRTPLTGASDHGVSEALYLTDPDGHGIEIYRDRPRAEWPRRPDGVLAMVTDPMDAQGVLAAGEGIEWSGMPPGTVMGHIHLHVSQLQKAEDFYVKQVGFDLVQHYGGQATFISAGGYHHHLGMNVWAGVGVPPAPDDRARMLWYEIVLPDATALDEVVERLQNNGVALEEHEEGQLLRDPSGNQVVLRSQAASDQE